MDEKFKTTSLTGTDYDTSSKYRPSTDTSTYSTSKSSSYSPSKYDTSPSKYDTSPTKYDTTSSYRPTSDVTISKTDYSTDTTPKSSIRSAPRSPVGEWDNYIPDLDDDLDASLTTKYDTKPTSRVKFTADDDDVSVRYELLISILQFSLVILRGFSSNTLGGGHF